MRYMGIQNIPHSMIGFTRNSDGSINLDDPSIIAEISGLAELMKVRFIAEAWDLATYQLGRSFPGLSWLQWNGRYRDDVRSCVREIPTPS